MLHILTLTWQACDKLTKLKESLLPALNGLDWTWIIKSNGCIDGTCEKVSTWGSQVKLIQCPDNRQNFSEGVNHCFQTAAPKDNDLVMLLNNDVIFNDTKSIKEMIALLKDDVGVVGARLFYPNSKKLQHAGVFINYNGLPLHFHHGAIDDEHSAKNREFQVVTGAVWLTKAEYFRNICTTNKSGINGLDEQFIWCFDDVDACLSIKYNLGKRIVYCGKTNIFHEESASLKKNPVNMLHLSHNVNLLRRKWVGRYQVDRPLYENNLDQGLLE
jgi:GT2 family glycosyltransferase